MRRRVFGLGVVMGLSGCLRQIQRNSPSQEETAGHDPTTGDPAPQSATKTAQPAATPSELKQRWSKNGAYGHPAYRDGTIYSVFDGVTAFSPDGTERWNRNIAGDNFAGLTAGSGGVYVPTQSGTVHGFGLEDGDELWRSTLPDGGSTRGIPAVFGETIVISSRDPNQLVAFDAENGSIEWTALKESGAHSEMRPGTTAPDGEFFVSTLGGETRIVSRDGTVTPTESSLPRMLPPAIDGDTAYLANRERLVRVHCPSGTVDWTKDVPFKAQSKPLLIQDSIVLPTSESGVASFDTKTGERRWHNDIGKVDWSPKSYRGRIFTGTEEGGCYVLHPSDGRTLLTADVRVEGTTYPVVGDGSIYYTEGANLVRIDVSYRE